MKEAIVIISALFLLTQGTAMAAQAGRDRIERGMRGYGCSSLMANVKLKLTVEQAIQLRALDEKCVREIDPIREQLYDKGRELKTEWLQPNPDRGRIEALMGEAAKLRERLRATLTAHRTEVLKVLTP
jgi:Spy/CpxP family protein refolding chaperone